MKSQPAYKPITAQFIEPWTNVSFEQHHLNNSFFEDLEAQILADLRATHDFATALNAMNILLKHLDDDHFEDINVHLVVAIIVNYAKPFTQSRKKDKQAEKYEFGRLRREGNCEGSIHNWIMLLRNKLIAHSDDKSFPPQLFMSCFNVDAADGSTHLSTPYQLIATSYSFCGIDDKALLLKMREHIIACRDTANRLANLEIKEYASASRLYDIDWRNAISNTPEKFTCITLGADTQTDVSHFIENITNAINNPPDAPLHRDECIYRALRIVHINKKIYARIKGIKILI